MLSFERLANAIAERLVRVACVPLLVFRVPEFERVAWRTGRRDARALEQRTANAFASVARNVVRHEDVLAHDAGSDCFAIALTAPARSGAIPDRSAVRAALERIAAATSLATGRPLETGWWPVERAETIVATLAMALERGARERRHGQLLATVGHELRTPLTSIRGYVETLLDGELDAATARRFLETVRREALRLGRLVDGMLEFSMLDLSAGWSGRVTDLVACASCAVETALPLARERNVTLHVNGAQEVHARIDADLCMHALVNLIENAVNYCGENGIVEVACVRDRRNARVTVDDDGPGVAACDRESIFNLGVRATTQRPGNGIGLAVVKAVIERAGGDVHAVESPLGGARFTVRLPLA